MLYGLKHASCRVNVLPGLVTTEVEPGCYHWGIDLEMNARKDHAERLKKQIKMGFFEKWTVYFRNHQQEGLMLGSV